MAENFTHLHVHSEYSLLDGAIRIRDLARAAAASGFNSLALTDHGATYGLIPFYKEMKELDLFPANSGQVQPYLYGMAAITH